MRKFVVTGWSDFAFHGINHILIDEEIKVAILTNQVAKAQPDGYESGFLASAWVVIGGNVCAAVKEFFGTELLTQLNTTVITQIPKIDSPSQAKDFRPISCCNVLYNGIYKLLCSRLKEVLPCLINENKAAFVKDRSAIQSILGSQELW